MVGLMSFGSQLAQSLNTGLDQRAQQQKIDAAAKLQADRQATLDARATTEYEQQQARLPIEQAQKDEIAKLTLKSAQNKSMDEERRVIGAKALAELNSYGANDSDVSNDRIDDAYINFSNMNKEMTDQGWKIEKSGKVGVFKITDPQGKTIEQARTPKQMLRAVYGFIDPTKDFEDTRELSQSQAAAAQKQAQALEVARIGAGSRENVAGINAGSRETVAQIYARQRALFAGNRNNPPTTDAFGNPTGGYQQPSSTVSPSTPMNFKFQISGGDRKGENTTANMQGVPLSVALTHADALPPKQAQEAREAIMAQYVANGGIDPESALQPSQGLQPAPINKAVVEKMKIADKVMQAEIKQLGSKQEPKATEIYGNLMLSAQGLSSQNPEERQQAVNDIKQNAFAFATLKSKDGYPTPSTLSDSIDIIAKVTGSDRSTVRRMLFDGASDAELGGKVKTVANPMLSAEEAIKQRSAKKTTEKKAPTAADKAAASNLNQF